MEKPFEYNVKIEYDELQEDLRIKPYYLLNIFQRGAIAASDDIGYTLSYFKEDKSGFLLTDYHAIIDKLPKYKDELILYTWTTVSKKMLLERSFRLVDKYGDCIAKAITKWVFFDLDKRKLKKINEHMINAYHLDGDKAIDNETYKILWNDGNMLKTDTILTKRMDIDTNMHVNHINYIIWAFNHIPAEVYEKKDLKEIRVCYKKEVLEGELLLVTTNEDKNEYYTEITKNDEISSIVYSRWENA